jgi:hypothetical protein
MAGPWEREYFQPENGNAVLNFVVFGELTADVEVSASEYRTSGPPKGTEMELFTRAEHGAWVDGWTEGYFGAMLADDPELEAKVKAAPTLAMLHGEVHDPSTLDYLRDAIGVVTALLDRGGVAVLDVLALRWFTSEEWRETIFEPAAPEPIEHVSLLASEEWGGMWLHSRGMRKFGRPDLSARELSQDDLETFAGLFESLIVTLAAGAVIPEGQRIRIAGTKVERTVHLRGDFEDPEFNNVHYELKA